MQQRNEKNQIGPEGSLSLRKIIVLEHISLDGVIQGPGGPDEDTSDGFKYGGWSAPFYDDVIGAAVNKKLDMPFDLLLGRKTFDIWAGFWPQHGDIWPNVNTATKYVVSNTMTSPEWQPSVFLNGDVAKKSPKLSKAKGPICTFGEVGIFFRLL